jgi:hypothetical protein
VIKINKARLVMEVEEQYDNISIEELAEGKFTPDTYADQEPNDSYTELPENSPRYVVLSHELKHKDGRISYPLVLINWAPSTSETGMLTLHASALLNFQITVSRNVFFWGRNMGNTAASQADVGKVVEIRDGPEALTNEEIASKLSL